MNDEQKNTRLLTDIMVSACRAFGFLDYMRDGMIGLYVRQSIPASYDLDTNTLALDQFHDWVGQAHSVPDHVFSRVFTTLQDKAAEYGIKVLMPESFSPGFDEMIKEYLRYDHGEEGGKQESGDGGGEVEVELQLAFEEELDSRLGSGAGSGDKSGVVSVDIDLDEIEDIGEIDYMDFSPPWPEELAGADEVEDITLEGLDAEASALGMGGASAAGLREEMAETVRAELWEELRPLVEADLRGEIWEDVYQEVRDEILAELRPGLVSRIEQDYDVEELEEIMGDGGGLDFDALRSARPAELAPEAEVLPDDAYYEDDIEEADYVGDIPVAEPAGADDVDVASGAASGTGEPTPAHPPSGPSHGLRADLQLKLIKDVREKLYPEIRDKLAAELAALAREREDRERMELRDKRCSDPDYCLDSIRVFLFEDQPAQWERVKPLVDPDRWRHAAELLEQDTDDFNREKLERSRQVLREALLLKADIHEERLASGEAGDDSEEAEGGARIPKLLGGADQVLDFALKSLSDVIEAEDPRPRQYPLFGDHE